MKSRGKRLPTPDSHVNGGNDAKTVVYNTKKYSKKGDGEKIQERKREKNVEEIQ